MAAILSSAMHGYHDPTQGGGPDARPRPGGGVVRTAAERSPDLLWSQLWSRTRSQTVPGRVLIESRGKFRGAPGSLRLAAPEGQRLFGKCFAVQRAQLAISNSLGATPSLGLQSSGSSVHGSADTRLRENSPENLCVGRDLGCAGSRPCGAGALR